jgi:hypothetical protein
MDLYWHLLRCVFGLKKVRCVAKKVNMELMPSVHIVQHILLLKTAAVKSGFAAKNI